MSYREAIITVDTTDIEERLDAIEAAGSDVISAILMYLKDKRSENMRMIKKDDGMVVDGEGDTVQWTPEIRAQVEAGLVETSRLIEALS